MKFAKTSFLFASVILVIMAAAPLVFAQSTRVRWDIVSLNLATGATSPGGIASAFADDGSRITIKGSGTFSVPADLPPQYQSLISGLGLRSVEVAPDGGGAWAVYASGATTPSATGTYVVTGLVRWDQKSTVGFPTGLAILLVDFSDGSHGVLTVSCKPGIPAMFEGITISKDYLDYFNRQAPVAGVDANRTLFSLQ